jgi:hypothetical protein
MRGLEGRRERTYPAISGAIESVEFPTVKVLAKWSTLGGAERKDVKV